MWPESNKYGTAGISRNPLPQRERMGFAERVTGTFVMSLCWKLILVLTTLLYLLIGFDQRPNIYDEGVALYGSMRILAGDLPYRDFWTMYAPGQFYLLAAFFQVFGQTVMVERWLTLLLKLGISIVVYQVARKLMRDRYAAAASLLATVCLGSYDFVGVHLCAALLLSLAGCLWLFRFVENDSSMSLFLGGMFGGLAVLFRHDLGLYTVLSQIVVLLAFLLLHRERDANFENRLLPRNVARVPGYYVLGVTVVVLPVGWWLANCIPVQDLIDCLIVFPSTVFPRVRALPFPSPVPPLDLLWSGLLSPMWYAVETSVRLRFYFPPLIYGLWAVMFIRRSLGKVGSVDTTVNWKAGFVFAMGVAFFNQVVVRSDSVHLMPTFVMAIILFCQLGSGIYTIPSRTRLLNACAYFSIACIFAGFLVDAGWKVSLYFLPRANPVAAGRAAGVVDPDESMHLPVVEYIAARVPPNERIFVGNERHDQILVNDVLFYFLTGRHCATKYHELHPGLATTAPIQKRIVDEITRHQVRYLVLVAMKPRDEPNDASLSSGVFILDRFIREEFAPVAHFGYYTVWKKKGIRMP